jgi:serine protease Do
MAEPERQQSDWRIGIEVAPVEPLIRQHLQIEKDAGVVVRMVDRGGPAAKAGIIVGDVIVRASGQKVKDTESLRRQVLEAGAKSRPLVLDLIHEGKRRQVRLSPPLPPQERLRPTPDRPAPAGGEAVERMVRSLREMN